MSYCTLSVLNSWLCCVCLQTGSKMFHCIHRSVVNSLVASANSDKVVRIWDTRMGGTFRSLLNLPWKLYLRCLEWGVIYMYFVSSIIMTSLFALCHIFFWDEYTFKLLYYITDWTKLCDKAHVSDAYTCTYWSFSPESSMVQSALTSHQGWVVAVQWSPNREHQLLSGSYDSSLK